MALATLVYTIIEAPGRGWTATGSLMGFAVAGVLLVAFVWWEQRTPHPMLDVERKRIIDLAMRNRLPVASLFRSWAEAGGLFSYGPNSIESYRRLAIYADKIFKGAKPADLPVEEPTKYELVINLKTAKALGLTIPQSLVVRADELIQ